MNDMNHNSSEKTAQSASGANAPEPGDKAALALKSSVVADAHHLTDEAKHVAGDVVTHARKSAEAQITGGKDRVAAGLGSVADAIRHTGEQLRSKEEAGLTEYVTRAADQVEAASDYLKEKSLGDVLGDVGGFARREPALFLGGAFVLGLVGGRFLKSSSARSTPSSSGSAYGQTASPRSEHADGRKHDARNNARGNASQQRGASSAKSGQTRPGSGEKPREQGSSSGSDGLYGNGGSPKMPGAV